VQQPYKHIIMRKSAKQENQTENNCTVKQQIEKTTSPE
jgi:hypothetical protein